MDLEPADDELLVEDVSLEMLQQLEASVARHGWTVEEEVLFLIDLALRSSEEGS